MKKNILIIDDDEDSLVLLVEMLRYADFDACGIQQTTDIFKVINQIKPDLILMDYILPGINGGELCHQIKTNTNTAHLPVVIISAYPRVLESHGRYGCDALIIKPFDINHFVSVINDCLHVSV